MFTTAATTLLALIGTTLALPAQNLAARETPGDVTFCEGANFSGKCTTVSFTPFDKCQPVPEAVKGNIGSLKVASGALCGLTFSEDTCTLHGDAMLVPESPISDAHHYTTVSEEVVDLGNELTSLLCQQCTACS
ncbi:hypothetical protein CC80DRAFT_590813 [Byssothecium circinans]|uniref:Uncharacterized protein n=1 Tax=Byssothecium circinans TaxID=147558 RepID=A0A6A5U431_9PLEO|nr:hypothetical protein CC80DRAFT_590813 [Byssothecium circinans]